MSQADRTAQLARYIERVVKQAPPLTAAQVDELRTLFRRHQADTGERLT